MDVLDGKELFADTIEELRAYRVIELKHPGGTNRRGLLHTLSIATPQREKYARFGNTSPFNIVLPSGTQNAPQSLAGVLQRTTLFFAIIPGGYALQLFQKCRPLAFRVLVCLTCAGRFLQKKERRSVPE